MYLQTFLEARVSCAFSSFYPKPPSPQRSTRYPNSSNPQPYVAVPSLVLPLGTGDHAKFKPMDLFKLDPTAQDKNLERKVTMDVEVGFFGGLSYVLSLASHLFQYPHNKCSLGDMLAILTISNGCNVYTWPLSANFNRMLFFNY